MWVTLYTDASYSPNDGGGWAIWLRSEQGRIVRHGKCPAYVCCSGAAELAAIYAGLYVALRAWRSNTRGVFVRSDSQEALRYVMPNAPFSNNSAKARLQLRIRELLGTDIEIRPKWVKGHQGRSKGTAAYLNNAVDRLAKRGRKSSS